MNFSRHQRQHLERGASDKKKKKNRLNLANLSQNVPERQSSYLQMQMRHLVRSLLNFLSFPSMYSRMVLSILMMAMMSDPKATVPRWKKTAFPNALHSGQVFRFFLSHVQYHEAKVPASTN